ncbi:hypothetical protein LPTSP3_g07200 [Leptospira kobayashii]|uniref:Uncharacterized protein n=1 Tax=Leptospira kobayashii TaxID=1917830 RepID=A0ABN6KD87_9LEPT|nr:hypothetical protein LPTSP3_g07200 [Leptospira kobayashii]
MVAETELTLEPGGLFFTEAAVVVPVLEPVSFPVLTMVDETEEDVLSPVELEFGEVVSFISEPSNLSFSGKGRKISPFGSGLCEKTEGTKKPRIKKETINGNLVLRIILLNQNADGFIV